MFSITWIFWRCFDIDVKCTYASETDNKFIRCIWMCAIYTRRYFPHVHYICIVEIVCKHEYCVVGKCVQWIYNCCERLYFIFNLKICMKDNWENWLNLIHTLNVIYIICTGVMLWVYQMHPWILFSHFYSSLYITKSLPFTSTYSLLIYIVRYYEVSVPSRRC